MVSNRKGVRGASSPEWTEEQRRSCLEMLSQARQSGTVSELWQEVDSLELPAPVTGGAMTDAAKLDHPKRRSLKWCLRTPR